MAFTLSADRVYDLYVHRPHWRLYISLRLTTIIISAITIACFVVAQTETKGSSNGEYNSMLESPYFEWIFFVPVRFPNVT